MHPDLQSIVDGLNAASARLQALAGAVDELDWIKRPAAESWSMDECVAHLTLTTQYYLPILDETVDAAPEAESGGRFRRDLAGWLLSRMLEPPVRIKTPTKGTYVPAATASREATVSAFGQAQAALIEAIRRLDGLDPTRIRMTSPFNAKLRYSIYSALHILAAHQRRHLWQAEQVRARLAAGR